MPDFDETNRGALFENDKGDNPNRPDYKGTINVDGKEYWLSMWDKVSKSNKAYFSLSVQPKEEQSQGRDSEAWKKAQDKYGNKPVENADEPINLGDIPF